MTNLFNRLILLLAVFILGTSSIYAQCILFPGNLVFTGVNLEDDGIDGATQNDRFSFVLLQNVNENFEIHFTDLGWTTSNSFQTKDRALTDGVIRWTAPVGGVVAGTQITIDAKYNLSATLGTVTGVRATPNDANIYLNLGNSGDQLFAFTGTIENPAFIAGINLNQNWTTLLTDKLTSSESALPASLSVANVQNVSLVSEFPNGFTNSVISGSIFNGQFSDIVAVFNQNANWSFDETYLPDAIPTGFQLPKALTFSITPFNFLNTPTGTSTITYGANTQFTVSKVDSRNITSYQWQVSTNNDADYSNLSDVGIYSGTNTATLVISKPQVEDSNNRYRAVAVDACGNEATSNHLTLTVNPKSLTASLIGTVEKERDGNTQATIANENLELTGQLTGDDVAVVNPGEGTYASALPGTNIQVTVTGLSITGADVLNYSLSSTSASANVGTIVDTTPPLVLGFELDNTSLSVGETTTVTVTFSEEVTGLTSTAFTVPNGVLSGLSSSDGGVTWTVTFTPNDGVEDVTNIISLANLGFADLTGNTGTGTTNSNNYSIDTQRPTATIVVSDTQLRAGETSLVTFTFSEAVAGFTNADLSVVNGILSSVSSSDGGITWTATLTPTNGINDATNLITLNNTGIADQAGNTGTGTTDSNNYSIDTQRPTATIVVSDTQLRAGETSLVTFTFSEAVAGFTNADLTVTNGTLSSVSSLDGGITWTATFTPTNGINDATNLITLNNTGIADQAGNTGTGTTDSNNYSIDTQRPTATIVVSDTQLRAGETSLVTFTFSEAVAGFTNADLSIANGILSSVSSSDGGITWTATLTPTNGINDATNLITLNNTGIADQAGNTGTGTTDSNNYSIDTQRPTATILVSDTQLRAGETSLVTFTFSEAVAGFTNADLTVTNGTLSSVSSLDGGITWTATFTPTNGINDATNLITLNNTGIADQAGNTGTGTTDSNNYSIDTQRPTATIVVSDTQLRAGETSLVTFTFSEAVAGFTNADLSVANGILSSVSSSDGGITWTATLTPTNGINDATNLITLNNTGIADQAGNTGTGTTDSNNYSIDTQRPTATIVVSDTQLRAGETSLVTFTFSEAVAGFTNADLSVANGTLSSVSSSDGGITWTATLTPTNGINDATNLITLNNTGIADQAGNTGTGTTDSNNYSIDTQRPTATIVVSDTQLRAGETSLVIFTFSEAVAGFTNADLSVANGTLSSVSSSDGGITWTATLTPTNGINDATNLITLNNTGIADQAGNTGTGTTDSNNYSIDTQRPTATIVVSDTQLRAGETSLVTFTFSEAVAGFTNADLSVANGILSSVSSSDVGITWTATLTPTNGINDATNLITLNNTGIADQAGNTGTGTTDSNNYSIDTQRPTATIVVSDTQLRAGETSLVTFTFSEAVAGFTNADLTVTNGTLSSVSSLDGGITWTATFTPTNGINDATNLITLNNTGIADQAGNTGTGTTDSNNYSIDTQRPTATIVVSDTQLRAGETSLVTFTFSEAVAGFTNADLSVANGILSSVSSSDGGITWTATLTPGAGVENDTNLITLDNTGYVDGAGNLGTGTTDSNNYTIDTQRPTATVVVADIQLRAGETSVVTITFTEAITGLAIDDFIVQNGSISGLSSSDGGITWTVTLTPDSGVADATNVITLDNAGYADQAGNTGTGTTNSNNYAIDTQLPTAIVVVADTQLSIGETSLVTITFSEPIAGLAIDDFTVQNGSISDLSTSDGGITWTVTLTPDSGVEDATNLISLNNTGYVDQGGNAGIGVSNSNNYSIDTQLPSGYSVSILTDRINGVNQNNFRFRLIDGEIGADFSYTITSSAGGTPITGIGEVTNSDQFISGIVVEDLPDGELTLTVTLTDESGNEGLPVSDTVEKLLPAQLTIRVVQEADEEGNDGLFEITTDNTFAANTTVTLEIGGTATSGVDYMSIGVELLFPGNTSTVSIPVSVIDDLDVEGDETVIIRLVSTNNSLVTIGEPSEATMTIADNDVPRQLTITPDANQQKVYGDEDPTTLSYTASGFELGDDDTIIQGSLTRQAGEDAGTYSYTLGNLDAGPNYELVLNPEVFTITPATLTIEVDELEKVYGDTDPDFAYTATGFRRDDITGILSGTFGRTAGENVGTYAFNLGTLSAGANYNLQLISTTPFLISPAPLRLIADDKQKIFNTTNPPLTFTYDGLVNGDTQIQTLPTIVTTATETSPAGTYPIILNGGSDSNYSISRVEGTLTIGQKAVTITANNQSKVYGQANPVLTFSYEGLLEGDTQIQTEPSISTEATISSNVGSYEITLSGGSDPNYDFTLVNGTLSVTPATLTITADDQSKVYGQANPPLTFSYAGLVNGDSGIAVEPSITSAASANSNVGTYDVTLTGGSDPNYAITRVNGTLTVTPADLTITADDQSKIYGAANPTLTFTYLGLVNGDTQVATEPSITTTATSSSNVGTYPITLSGGLDANYDITLVNGTLTVGQKAVTITAENQSKVYGEENPTLTFTYTGLVNGDEKVATEPSIATTATESSNVGSHPITLSGGVDANYAITLVNGTLTVGQKAVTITAEDKSKIYGEANPALTFTYTGLVNGDTQVATEPSIATSATASSNVGTYPITLSGGIDANYNITLVDGELEVTQATLTITANEGQSKIFGTADPVLSYFATGFAAGDDEQVLTGNLTRATGEVVGTYPINLGSLAAGGNYQIVYTSADFEIIPAVIEAVMQPAPIETVWGVYPGLPSTVTVMTTDGQFLALPITWDLQTLYVFGNGEYPLTASINLPSGILNTEALTVEIVVTVLPKPAPEDILLDNNSFEADAGLNFIAVGNLTVIDPIDNQHDISLADLAFDNVYFQINNGTLFWNSVERADGRTEFKILVRVQDRDGNILEKEFTIIRNRTSVSNIEIFNSFTPDGDNVNDTWGIKELRFYKGVRIQIFERSGKRLFYTENPDVRWDGTFNSTDMPTGTYYWTVEVGETGEVRKGMLNLIRK